MNRAALLATFDQASADLHHITDVIVPFGLEVSPEFDAGKMSPQRAYVYASVADSVPCDAAAAELSEWVVQQRGAIADAVGRELAYVTADSRRNVRELNREGLGVHIYIVADEPGVDLIQAWGAYVALIPSAIHADVLREYVHFDERPSCRRFVFQSARMFPFIHGVPWSDHEEAMLREAAVLNGSRLPGNPLRLKIAATEFDQRVLDDVVLPKCREIVATLEPGATELHWTDFHSRERHALTANMDIVAARAAFVSDSYRTWGLARAEHRE